MLPKYNIMTISYNFINDFLGIILYNNYFFFNNSARPNDVLGR